MKGVGGAATVAGGEQFVAAGDGVPNRFAGRIDRWQERTTALQSRDEIFQGRFSNGDKD